MQSNVVIRSGWDRLRYTLAFEGILVGIFSIFLAFLFEREVSDTGALAVLLSLKAMLVAYVYNYYYDRFDARHGRVPTERTVGRRMVHAFGFEAILVATTVPVVVWWLEIGWWYALFMDLGLMAAVVVYTYFFTLAYDRLFPVAQPALDPNPNGATA